MTWVVQLAKVTGHLDSLPTLASSLTERCQRFEAKAASLRSCHQRIRLTLQHHSQVRIRITTCISSCSVVHGRGGA